MKEKWRPIPGLPDYAASSEGRIRRETTSPGAKAGRIISPIKGRGSPTVWVGQSIPRELLARRLTSNVPHRLPISRLVLFTFKGRPPHPDMVARTRDGDLNNLRITNLYWGARIIHPSGWVPTDERKAPSRAAYMRARRAKQRGEVE